MSILRNPGRLSFAGAFAATAIALAAFSNMAFGDEVRFALSGDKEVPAVKTAASGSGTFVINADMTVSGSVTTKGVAATMAHIHQGAVGVNGPVLIPLSRAGDNLWTVPAGAKLTDAQYQAYKNGELYVNVHSAENKGGEIRGQLVK